jgi:hypothetical protein
MNRIIIDQLRRFSSVPGKEKTWVSELSDEKLYELFLKLRSGESCRSIARHVQKVWKVCPKSSLHSVSQGVLKFKQRITHLLLPSLSEADSDFTDTFPKDTESDSLATMENIARQYEARIKRMMNEENETGVKYPFINRDLQALASLRKAILKQKEWSLTHDDPIKLREDQLLKESIAVQNILNLLKSPA